MVQPMPQWATRSNKTAMKQPVFFGIKQDRIRLLFIKRCVKNLVWKKVKLQKLLAISASAYFLFSIEWEKNLSKSSRISMRQSQYSKKYGFGQFDSQYKYSQQGITRAFRCLTIALSFQTIHRLLRYTNGSMHSFFQCSCRQNLDRLKLFHSFAFAEHIFLRPSTSLLTIWRSFNFRIGDFEVICIALALSKQMFVFMLFRALILILLKCLETNFKKFSLHFLSVI